MASEHPRELIVPGAAECGLVHNNYSDGPAIGLVWLDTERRAEAARPYRVVADLAERGAQESARPLLGHDDEHSRGRCWFPRRRPGHDHTDAKLPCGRKHSHAHLLVGSMDAPSSPVISGAMVSAHEALERLREGNLRFAANVRGADAFVSHTRRVELASGQQPFAIILGCSDSRVPAEIVFDQGLGDLFVIRVAGNIVAPSQVGSVEFAAERYHTRLVVVLGHSQCGAIVATLEELRTSTGNYSHNLRAIVDRIRPAIEGLFATDLSHNPDALIREAVRANIRASVDHLRHGSQVLEELIRNEGLLVVAAEYSLDTGVVDFFDGEPQGR